MWIKSFALPSPSNNYKCFLFLVSQFLLDEETVGVAPSLGPEDGQDQAEEEGEQGQPNHGQNPPLAHIPLTITSLGEHDHAAHDEPVDNHHKVGLQHKLSLR